jgi:hypothetical protein
MPMVRQDDEKCSWLEIFMPFPCWSHMFWKYLANMDILVFTMMGYTISATRVCQVEGV